jgi:hypothetical protein
MWTKTNSQPDTFVTEMSTLQANNAFNGIAVKCQFADPSHVLQWNIFTPLRNGENEIYQWEAQYHGKKYVIFND